MPINVVPDYQFSHVVMTFFAASENFCQVKIHFIVSIIFFFNVSTRDVKTQSFTAIRFFNYFIFSLKPCKPEAPKLLCPFVLIFRKIIAFKLVKKPKNGAVNENDRTLWLYSGKIEAKLQL